MKLILDELAPLAGEEAQYMMRAEALLSVPHAPDGATLVPRAVVQSTLSAINIALEKVQGVIDRTTPSAQQELQETEVLNAARKAELGVPIEPRHPDEDNQAPAEDQEMETPAPALETPKTELEEQDMQLVTPLEDQEIVTPKTELEDQEMQMDDGTGGQGNGSTNESQEAHDDEENITPCSKTTPKAKSGASKASTKKHPRAKPTAKAKSKSCKKPAKNVKKVPSAKKGKPKKTDDKDTALKKKLHSAAQLRIGKPSTCPLCQVCNNSCVRSICIHSSTLSSCSPFNRSVISSISCPRYILALGQLVQLAVRVEKSVAGKHWMPEWSNSARILPSSFAVFSQSLESQSTVGVFLAQVHHPSTLYLTTAFHSSPRWITENGHSENPVAAKFL